MGFGRHLFGIFCLGVGHRGGVLCFRLNDAVPARTARRRLYRMPKNVNQAPEQIARDALRQSVLRKAFAGKLVPQDPDDEPAQAVLARIRASRGGDSTKKPRRRAGRRATATAPT